MSDHAGPRSKSQSHFSIKSASLRLRAPIALFRAGRLFVGGTAPTTGEVCPMSAKSSSERRDSRLVRDLRETLQADRSAFVRAWQQQLTRWCLGIYSAGVNQGSELIVSLPLME